MHLQRSLNHRISTPEETQTTTFHLTMKLY